MKLIIARPSPFARKTRVFVIEKDIACDIVVENPWQPDTTVSRANPLGKVPTLLLDDGTAVHDSRVIVEYLETLDRPPRLIPDEPSLRIAHRQIEAVADGICDAVVLTVLEGTRPEGKRSDDWLARQQQKIAAGTAELERLLGDRETFTTHGFGLAEIAAGCALGYLDLRHPAFDWRRAAPGLVPFFERVSSRPSFELTKPALQAVPATL
ncbi:MAG: glutathione S-transferase [Betaproteobacteria bacterium]|nr:glutathione S-transferase [Betaproteobacteria bacterium]